MVRTALLFGWVSMGCMGAPGDGRGDADDDVDTGSCSDQDGDGYGGGLGCIGLDCDDSDPNTFENCGANCGADPTGFRCPCAEGAVPVECFMGPDGTEAGIGVCAAGVRQCSAEGTWGECIGQTLPREEICNQVDDDCDGDSDEGLLNADGTCDGGAGGCEERARWIYVVTSDDWLVKFEPDALRFTDVGRLDCPAPAGWKPFSMSVARDGDAYVLYRSFEDLESAGVLFKVSTADASCEETDYAAQSGWGSYGMGFSSDSEGSEEETLFVGGGDGSPGLGGSVSLGRMDPPDLGIDSVGRLTGWCELTGTGSAELWGYFPQDSPAAVHQIDKESGEVSGGWTINLGGSGMTYAWAFAFWGGKFYIFHQDLLDPSTKVFALNPETDSIEEVISETGMQIVGAGVSTCAPVELI